MTISSIDCNKVDPTTWVLTGSKLDCYEDVKQFKAKKQDFISEGTTTADIKQ